MEYRSAVESRVAVCALVVRPKRAVGAFLKHLRGMVFCHRGVRSVSDTDGDGKTILLDPLVVPAQTANIDGLPDAVKEAITKAASVSPADVAVRPSHSVELTYQCFTMPELLKKVLPANVTALSGFEQVGHIAHVNLSAGHLPFQKIIGQVILDTNNTVKTVVNKVDSISSVFREFKMEVIAGDASAMTATVRQHGFVFEVPYDKVYWNSRLGDEHTRLVGLMNPGDELFDVMAGVGPFAVPAAAAGVHVHANDLNPASYEAMKRNAELNGVTLHAYNMDGREFIDKIVREQHLETAALPNQRRRHLSMNLPALAVQFLDTFTRPSWRAGRVVDRSPIIHCYTFSSAVDVKEDAIRQIEAVLGVSLDGCVELAHDVRDVAPTKQMVCVSFRLPHQLTESASARKRSRSPEESSAVCH